ncbi:hypothetical protein [Roseovarius sp. THAF8]|uniref:hypothetical protein n=1 Tax=Roseovarius sp. THAF8 TaxID=2587846 RepID=UPI0015620476|nr:hypothetical protein [Roseovarius sp. THAF8]
MRQLRDYHFQREQINGGGNEQLPKTKKAQELELPSFHEIYSEVVLRFPNQDTHRKRQSKRKLLFSSQVSFVFLPECSGGKNTRNGVRPGENHQISTKAQDGPWPEHTGKRQCQDTERQNRRGSSDDISLKREGPPERQL